MNKKNLIKKIEEEFPQIKFKNVKQVTCGLDHVVLILDNKYVFRFPKNDYYKKKIKVEMRLLSELQKKTSKIPDYKFIPIDQSFGGYPIIDGKPLSTKKFNEFTNQQKTQLANELADFLTALHKIPISKAKKIGLKFEWSHQDELKQYKERRKHIKKVLNPEEMRFVDNLMKKYVSLNLPKNSLVHHDLSEDHILAKNNKLSGIIDFGDSSLNDPAVDFAWFWEWGENFVQKVYRRYNGKKDKELLSRSQLYNIVMCLSWIYHGVVDKKKLWLNRAVKRIRKAMKE
ncbi:MAG: phosphotransferase [Nanoarchaeota archaeon]|nr:phosphotransferase [Nanoarchaeota archaeon]